MSQEIDDLTLDCTSGDETRLTVEATYGVYTNDDIACVDVDDGHNGACTYLDRDDVTALRDKLTEILAGDETSLPSDTHAGTPGEPLIVPCASGTGDQITVRNANAVSGPTVHLRINDGCSVIPTHEDARKLAHRILALIGDAPVQSEAPEEIQGVKKSEFLARYLIARAPMLSNMSDDVEDAEDAWAVLVRALT